MTPRRFGCILCTGLSIKFLEIGYREEVNLNAARDNHNSDPSVMNRSTLKGSESYGVHAGF